MDRVEVDLGESSYPILIEPASLSRVGKVIRDRARDKRLVVISDENVDQLYGTTLVDSLENAGLRFEKLVVEPGESAKSLEVAEDLYEEMAELNLHRDSVVLAFGGGVIGDLAGFVASTFLRGIPVIQLPTTLLAQVDSSVGGKTAVNLSRGKNLVGTFHQPDLVAIDPVVLETLSLADLRSGLGEVLKYGLIWDEDFFWEVMESIDIFTGVEDAEKIGRSISRCCEIKAEVVGRDERDKGIRRILNFGHTLGHGIEAGSGYGEMKHGEAVIWGMLAEIRLSYDRGYLKGRKFSRLVAALSGLDLPPLPDNFSPKELIGYVKRDKKVLEGEIYSVLIKDPGEDVVVEQVSEEECKSAWGFLRELEVAG